jgi:VanZ family protein
MSIAIRHWMKFWLPPLIWMAVISLFSTDHFSGHQTSRLIGPLLRFFVPDIADATIASIQLVVRKAGHLTEYAILFLLWYRALNATQHRPLQVWKPAYAAGCLTICLLYAGTDEWHQTLTDERVGSPVDVGIDTLGGALAMGWIRWRTRRQKE